MLLEKRFINTFEYIKLSDEEPNRDAYSDIYALLIQAIGAELDSVFKEYCGFASNERRNIKDYVTAIDLEEQNVDVFPNPIREQRILIPEFGLWIQPFKEWNSDKPATSLAWWDAFDKLKHNRFENRKCGNQRNTLDILGALYLVEMRLLKKTVENTDEVDVFDSGSEIFLLKNWSNKVITRGMEFEVLGELFVKGMDEDSNLGDYKRLFDVS